MARAIYIDTFMVGWFLVRSKTGKQTVNFEDSNEFGPSLVDCRTGAVKPMPDKHWFWKFYTPWLQAGRPVTGQTMGTPCGQPLQFVDWIKDDD